MSISQAKRTKLENSDVLKQLKQGGILKLKTVTDLHNLIDLLNFKFAEAEMYKLSEIDFSTFERTLPPTDLNELLEALIKYKQENPNNNLDKINLNFTKLLSVEESVYSEKALKATVQNIKDLKLENRDELLANLEHAREEGKKAYDRAQEGSYSEAMEKERKEWKLAREPKEKKLDYCIKIVKNFIDTLPAPPKKSFFSYGKHKENNVEITKKIAQDLLQYLNQAREKESLALDPKKIEELFARNLDKNGLYHLPGKGKDLANILQVVSQEFPPPPPPRRVQVRSTKR